MPDKGYNLLILPESRGISIRVSFKNEKTSKEGATPKLTSSASESSSFPIGEYA